MAHFGDDIHYEAPKFNSGYRMTKDMYDALAAQGAKEPRYGAHHSRNRFDPIILQELNNGVFLRTRKITSIILH